MEQATVNNYIDQNQQTVVLTIKYKIYIVVLILITVICRGYMSDAVAEHDAMQQSITQLQNQKIQKETEYQQVVQDLTTVKNINSQKAALVTCFSTRGCTNLPENLTGFAAQTKAFLQLEKNDAQKMAFDQKRVLANINEYLLKGANNAPNGSITSITFGNLFTAPTIDNLIELPITLTIDFADKNGLLTFVYNVENTISPQFPMLYKISSVNYDIVKYQQNQTVSIELIGYMIK